MPQRVGGNGVLLKQVKVKRGDAIDNWIEEILDYINSRTETAYHDRFVSTPFGYIRTITNVYDDDKLPIDIDKLARAVSVLTQINTNEKISDILRYYIVFIPYDAVSYINNMNLMTLPENTLILAEDILVSAQRDWIVTIGESSYGYVHFDGMCVRGVSSKDIRSTTFAHSGSNVAYNIATNTVIIDVSRDSSQLVERLEKIYGIRTIAQSLWNFKLEKVIPIIVAYYLNNGFRKYKKKDIIDMVIDSVYEKEMSMMNVVSTFFKSENRNKLMQFKTFDLRTSWNNSNIINVTGDSDDIIIRVMTTTKASEIILDGYAIDIDEKYAPDIRFQYKIIVSYHPGGDYYTVQYRPEYINIAHPNISGSSICMGDFKFPTKLDKFDTFIPEDIYVAIKTMEKLVQTFNYDSPYNTKVEPLILANALYSMVSNIRDKDIKELLSNRTTLDILLNRLSVISGKMIIKSNIRSNRGINQFLDKILGKKTVKDMFVGFFVLSMGLARYTNFNSYVGILNRYKEIMNSFSKKKRYNLYRYINLYTKLIDTLYDRTDQYLYYNTRGQINSALRRITTEEFEEYVRRNRVANDINSEVHEIYNEQLRRLGITDRTDNNDVADSEESSEGSDENQSELVIDVEIVTD